MKNNLKLLYRLINQFSITSGVNLFVRFYSGSLSNLKIPNIKTKVSLRKGTSDIPTFFQIFLFNEYDLDFIENPKVIIDGGANIGLFSVMMKNKFADAKIISIEPDKENFEMLKKNVSGYQDIFCENCGLWNKETNLKVHDKLDRGKWGMMVEETDEAGDVKAISIDSIMDKYSIERIDILKLDIETSEKKLFLDNYERWLPKTKMLIIELHDFMEEGCSKSFFSAINKTFNNYEYAIKGENTAIINNDII
jgi:FkbM family methyltransferase